MFRYRKKAVWVHDDLSDALDDDDCDEIKDQYAKIISLVSEAESCSAIEDLMDEFSAEDADDLIDLLEEERNMLCNCSSLESLLSQLSDDIQDAYDNEDCEEVQDIYNQVISLVKRGESCAFVDEIMDDYGVDNVSDLVEDLEDERDNACDW